MRRETHYGESGGRHYWHPCWPSFGIALENPVTINALIRGLWLMVLHVKISGDKSAMQSLLGGITSPD
jgi:hypothetical protein